MKLQVQQIGRRKSKANEKKPKYIRTCKDLNCKFHPERNCKRKQKFKSDTTDGWKKYETKVRIDSAAKNSKGSEQAEGYCTGAN